MRRPIRRHPRPLEMGPESPGHERRIARWRSNTSRVSSCQIGLAGNALRCVRIPMTSGARAARRARAEGKSRSATHCQTSVPEVCRSRLTAASSAVRIAARRSECPSRSPPHSARGLCYDTATDVQYPFELSARDHTGDPRQTRCSGPSPRRACPGLVRQRVCRSCTKRHTGSGRR